MSFQSLDETKLREYDAEAKRRWGETDAYREYEQRSGNLDKAQQNERDSGLMQLFVEFGALRSLPPQSPQAQSQARKLQDYITAHYYTCTKPILSGLGQMYAAGGEMTANIDAAETARRIGIRRERSANYRYDKDGTGKLYECMSEVVTSVRCSAPIAPDWKKKLDCEENGDE